MHTIEKTPSAALELAVAIEEHVLCGRKVVLSPPTALWIARQIQNAIARRDVPPVKSHFNIDLYASGSCVMQVNSNEDIVEVVAWAKSSIAARAAFDHLCDRDPERSYQQRRGGWIEGDRLVKRG